MFKKPCIPNLPPSFHELQDFFQVLIEAAEAIDHEPIIRCTDIDAVAWAEAYTTNDKCTP
jgi:hypothetical protein